MFEAAGSDAQLAMEVEKGQLELPSAALWHIIMPLCRSLCCCHSLDLVESMKPGVQIARAGVRSRAALYMHMLIMTYMTTQGYCCTQQAVSRLLNMTICTINLMTPHAVQRDGAGPELQHSPSLSTPNICAASQRHLRCGKCLRAQLAMLDMQRTQSLLCCARP